MNYWVAPAIEKIKYTENVFQFIAERYNITIEDIKGSSRKGKLPEARHIVMAILREKTNLTLDNVGELFNHKYDHTSVLHAVDNCTDGGKFQEQYNRLSKFFQKVKEGDSEFNSIKTEKYKKINYNFTFIKPLCRSGFFYLTNDTIEEYKQNGLWEEFNNFIEAYDCSLIPINKNQTKIVLNNFKKIA